ncbi:hypothetical protein [Nocardia sp. alder85J]|uniref:hypothetical protein n=1 Tax=Nocardia sp. alder85J TaxID=2862949 RepID=UPI001CD42C4E|nr:hypothetical protein [Nocardia sp. alder85J]MCX4091078.1 hypothetical protein [Nocardia sp. alder85J]
MDVALFGAQSQPVLFGVSAASMLSLDELRQAAPTLLGFVGGVDETVAAEDLESFGRREGDTGLTGTELPVDQRDHGLMANNPVAQEFMLAPQMILVGKTGIVELVETFRTHVASACPRRCCTTSRTTSTWPGPQGSRPVVG